MPGIPLDDRGREQARALAARLAPVPLDAIISSPLERCRQTADAIAATGDSRPPAVLEDERLGAGAVYLICSHGDVIKSVIADSLGMHIDMLQRIQVDPCSLTAIRYTPLRPFVLRMNDTGGGVASLKK